jgi:adrenodoxin-NADP+ reductase
VNWYNGHPAYAHLAPDLSGEEVTIVGHGNVAIDCARILLKPPAEFASTDMPTPIIEHLKTSKVKRVEVVGRRGPAQVAFTTKEFREMVNLEGIRYEPVKGDMLEQAKGMVQGDRARSRLLDLMAKGGKKKPSGSVEDKEFRLGFLRSPKSFLSDSTSSTPKRISSILWAQNALLPQPSTPPSPSPGAPADPASVPTASSLSVLARPTGEEFERRTGMVIESVGYRGEPIWDGEGKGQGEMGGVGVPFDQARARVMNLEGRVTDGSGVMVSNLIHLQFSSMTTNQSSSFSISQLWQVPGMYTAGWIASGPIGVIASTMQRAYAVASTILTDHYQSPATSASASSSMLNTTPELGATPDFVKDSTKRVVELGDWKRIDEAEVVRGQKAGGRKPREKFVSIREMLGALD